MKVECFFLVEKNNTWCILFHWCSPHDPMSGSWSAQAVVLILGNCLSARQPYWFQAVVCWLHEIVVLVPGSHVRLGSHILNARQWHQLAQSIVSIPGRRVRPPSAPSYYSLTSRDSLRGLPGASTPTSCDIYRTTSQRYGWSGLVLRQKNVKTTCSCRSVIFTWISNRMQTMAEFPCRLCVWPVIKTVW